jgi:hypothetical protein
MGLSDLTNKELKNILRENDVKNYSKFNKKDLVKMVNQLINAQNGGKNEKIKNGKKKYKLKELIGGEPPEVKQPLLSNNNRNKNSPITNNTNRRGSYEPPSANNIQITNSERQAFLQKQQQKQQQQEQQQQEQLQQEQQQQEQQQQEQQQQEQLQQPTNNSANNPPVKSLNKNDANKIIQKNQSQSNIVPDSVETIVNNQEKCKACTIL